MKRARGFTLLEVLIALAIVAMSVGALLGTVTSSASNVIYLKDKTLAEWVALNRLTEIRIAQADARHGQAHRQRASWAACDGNGKQEVVELPVKGMFRVDVRARPTGETVDDSAAGRQAPLRRTEPSSSPSGATLEKARLDHRRDRRGRHGAVGRPERRRGQSPVRPAPAPTTGLTTPARPAIRATAPATPEIRQSGRWHRRSQPPPLDP